MNIIDLAISDFLDTYKYQIDVVNKVSLDIAEQSLIITEHKPVMTIGRKGSWKNFFKSREELSRYGIEVLNVDRGGDVTYHGPGQIVAYPVCRLENEARDIHNFLHFLEEIGRHFLFQYGVFSEEKPGFRGVWVRGKKIGSIGIGVKKWVTYHGLALNINTDLAPFSFIRPCGIEGVETTSLKDILGQELDIYDAKQRLIEAFKEIPLLAETAGQSQ